MAAIIKTLWKAEAAVVQWRKCWILGQKSWDGLFANRKMFNLSASFPHLQNGGYNPCLFLQGCCGDQVR